MSEGSAESGVLQGGRRAIVLGAGVSGLGTAVALEEAGWSCTVLEPSERCGGVIQSTSEGGFLCESGPSEMLVKSAEVLAFLERLGLQGKLQEANSEARKRFLIRRGRLLEVPMGPWGLLRTRLWSWGGRLRVAAEPFVGRMRPADGEESLASFVRRRLGPELLDYGIGPLASGIYAGDPERLAIRHAFPKVWNLEHRFGSLILGAVRLMLERRRQGHRRFPSRLVSFAGGMETLPKALAGRLPGAVLTGAEVSAIRPQEAGWQITWRSRGGPEVQAACGLLVVAVPAWRLGALPFPEGLRARLERLEEIPYAPVTAVVQGFRRDAVAHPLDGFGVLAPAPEARFALGTLFLSTLFPGRAPEGQVCLHSFVGGMRHPERVLLPDEALARHLRQDLDPLLGLTGEPVFWKRITWERAIPQYHGGHQRFLDTMAEVENEFPNLCITGNFRRGVGVGDCLQAALDLARSKARS